MKKLISLILTAVLLLTAFTTVTAEVKYEPLTEIGDLSPHMHYQSWNLMGITYKKDGVLKNASPDATDNSEVTDEDIDFFTEIFSDANLAPVSEDISLLKENFSNIGFIEFLGTNGTANYAIMFNEDYVYIEIDDVYLNTIQEGFFTYKDSFVYNSLINRMDTIFDRKEILDNQKEKETSERLNKLQITDFKILYSATLPPHVYTPNFEWGVCSYICEGESTPTTACYYSIPTGDTIKIICKKVETDNVIYFPASDKRALHIEPDKNKEYEFTYNNTPTYFHKLEIKVNENMLVESVIITSTAQFDSNIVVKKEYDKSVIVQTGSLPKEMFSVTETKNETEITLTPEKNTSKEENETTTEKKETTEPAKEEMQEEVKPEQPKEEIIEEETSEEKPVEEKTEEKVEEKEEQQPEITTEITPEIKESVTFYDVPATHWAYEAVEEFYDKEIVLGYGNGYFGVDDSITYEHYGFLLQRLFNYAPENMQTTPALREEIIVALVKALDLDLRNTDESIIEKTFSDCGNLQPYNRRYIAAAIENGLVIGSDGNLFPQDNLTRAETVVILSRGAALK